MTAPPNGPRHAADPALRFSSIADVYRNSLYTRFPQEHRAGGSFGLELVRAVQGPIDLIDAPVPGYAFGTSIAGTSRIGLEIGDGLVEFEFGPERPAFNIVPPETPARFHIDSDHIALTVGIPASRMHALLAEYALAGTPFADWYVTPRREPDRAALTKGDRLLRAVWDALDPAAPSPLLADGLLLQLVAQAAAPAGQMRVAAPARLDDGRLARVVDYVEAHLDQTLGVAELAAVAALSPAHLSRTFKAATGETVHYHVLRRRCERARDMLTRGREPIAHIAFACGFASQAHMTTAFRKAFGITPGAMRSANER